MALSQALSEEEFHRMQVRESAVAFLQGLVGSCLDVAFNSRTSPSSTVDRHHGGKRPRLPMLMFAGSAAGGNGASCWLRFVLRGLVVFFFSDSLGRSQLGKTQYSSESSS